MSFVQDIPKNSYTITDAITCQLTVVHLPKEYREISSCYYAIHIYPSIYHGKGLNLRCFLILIFCLAIKEHTEHSLKFLTGHIFQNKIP